jgi:predicted alpha/beta-fold hydrolase
MECGLGFEVSAFKPWFAGGHRQTLYAWAKLRRFPRLPPPVERYFDVAPDARVLAHCHWHAHAAESPTLLLLHGLEGSSLAHYICGISEKAWTAGWNVVRLNQRNCGGTEHLSRGLYHSGLTHDPLFVMRELIRVDRVRALAVAGYSLGGNLTLKLAGELGESAPPELAAVCAVSPTLELAVCVEALERRGNLLYEWNFVRNLRARMKRKAAAWPDVFDLAPLRGVRTVRQFDEAFTAPHHGFRDAADYYHRASAMRVIDRIRVPALIITAEDDPFVPPHPFRDPLLACNPFVTVAITPSGGHCAYVEKPDGDYDGYWAEREIVRFATSRVRVAAREPAPGDRASAARTPAPSQTLRA